MNKQISKDFKYWMRPLLRDYYNSRIEQLKSAIDEVIPGYPTQELLKTALGEDYFQIAQEYFNNALYKPMGHYIKLRGKLFRPLICCMFIEAYGKDPDQFKEIIAMSEIIHSCSLILDDIADASQLRRGKPCSHMVYGIPRAANGSSAMTFYVFRLLQSDLCPIGIKEKTRLYEILIREHYVTSIGSALDLGWARDKVNAVPEDQYIQHVLFRSCSYTYRHAALLGAVAAGAGDKDQNIISRYSSLIGLAFQLIDDILNLKPELNSWGKIPAEDITEGKRSLLFLYAYKKANGSDRTRLSEIIDGKVTDNEILGEAINILDRYGSFKYASEKAENFVKEAIDLIQGAGVGDEYKSLFSEYASYVTERKI